MGGLSHYLEEEGLATTQISLVREHTQAIRPPRALWVPFELGRPLGPPNDPDFQTEVLAAALGLFEAPSGPVLADFPKDAPETATAAGPLACPVDFSPRTEPVTDTDRLLAAFKQEASQMRTWYDLAVKIRSRTTANTSGMPPGGVVEQLAAWVTEGSLSNPLPHVPLGTAIKMVVEDLKAYYLEALTAQPGQPADSGVLADWFWGQTAAARVICRIRNRCAVSGDERLKLTGNLLVPRAQLHRFENPK